MNFSLHSPQSLWIAEMNSIDRFRQNTFRCSNPGMNAGLRTLALAVLVSLIPGFLFAQAQSSDWTSWRGPATNGKAPASAVLPPLEWDETKNVIWKVPIPGRGHSCPIVLRDRIYMATADAAKGTQSVICHERATGKPVWKRDVHVGGLPPEIHNKNTHASSTIATNGKGLFIPFLNGGKTVLSALALDGRVVWQKTIAPFRPKYPFGFAASPALFKDLVIIASESEAETCLVAFKQVNGAEVWRTQREQNSSYSSPALLTIDGKPVVVMSGSQAVRAYDPATGREVWSAPGSAKHTAGTVTGEGNHVVASGGYPQNETVCVEVRGGVARPIWTNRQKVYEQSMLMHGGHVYAVNDTGIAYCWRIADGEEKWRNRLKGPISASPTLVGDRIYISNERGTTFVFRANPERFELLAENQLGDDTFPTAAFLDGKIYLRTAFRDGTRQEFLYCLGSKE